MAQQCRFLSVEGYRGLDALDDNLYAGLFQAMLRPGESLTIVASTDSTLTLDGASAYAERQAYEGRLMAQSGLTDAPAWVQHLILAADQFIVRRAPPDDPDGDGRTVIAGYPWFGDWGRDTMISLPGLTLVTGRPEVAARILRTFAHFVDQGMLPNRLWRDSAASPMRARHLNTKGWTPRSGTLRPPHSPSTPPPAMTRCCVTACGTTVPLPGVAGDR